MLLRNVFNSVLIAALRFRMIAGRARGIRDLHRRPDPCVELGWGLSGIAVTMIAQQIVGTLMTLPPAVRMLDRRAVRLLSRADTAQFFGYAWKVQISGLSGMLQLQKDQLVAGRLLSAQESGPFGQGSNFAMQIRMLPLNALAPVQAMFGEGGELGAHDALPTAVRLQRTWVRLMTGWCVLGTPATYVGVRAWLPEPRSVGDRRIDPHRRGLLPAVRRRPQGVDAQPRPPRHRRPSLDRRPLRQRGIERRPISPLGTHMVSCRHLTGQVGSALFYTWAARQVLGAAPRVFLRDVPWWQALVSLGVVIGLELWCAPLLPRGGLGLVAAAGVAVPGALLFVALTFGREGWDFIRVRRRTRA